MPLRLLVVTYDISPVESRGSFRSQATDNWHLVEQLSRFCDVTVLTSGNQDNILDYLSQGALPRVRFHFVDPPEHWLNRFRVAERSDDVSFYLWEKRALREARTLHQKNAFDAVHHLSPDFASTPPLLSSSLRIPSLWGPLTPEVRLPRNGAHTRRTLPERLGGGLRRILQTTGDLHSLRPRRYPKEGVVLLSDSAPDALNNFSLEARENVYQFPFGGISKERMVSAASLSESRGEFLVLAAGDFRVADGYLHLLRAFFEFSREHRNAELAVVGCGWQDERIGSLMRELSLGSRIELWDWIPRGDLRDKLTQAHVFIAPDFDVQTASLCVDAMAAGVPVVAFQGSGAHLFVEDKWGIQISWEDPRQIIRDLKEALDRIADHSSLRRKMARSALRHVRENLVWERQGKALESLYSQTLLQTENIRVEHTGKGRFFY